MEDFPTGTNEDFFSSSSVYSASIKFRAYLLMSAPLKFHKFTPLSYVNTRVNLYTIICTTATYSQKRTPGSDLRQMELLVALLEVSALEQGEQGYLDVVDVVHYRPKWVLLYL